MGASLLGGGASQGCAGSAAQRFGAKCGGADRRSSAGAAAAAHQPHFSGRAAAVDGGCCVTICVAMVASCCGGAGGEADKIDVGWGPAVLSAGGGVIPSCVLGCFVSLLGVVGGGVAFEKVAVSVLANRCPGMGPAWAAAGAVAARGATLHAHRPPQGAVNLFRINIIYLI